MCSPSRTARSHFPLSDLSGSDPAPHHGLSGPLMLKAQIDALDKKG